MNWGRYIQRTAVRRVVWIVVGLGVYALLGVLGVVRAQTSTYESAPDAFAACKAEADRTVRQDPNNRRWHDGTCAHNAGLKRFSCNLERRYSSGGEWIRNLGCGTFNYSGDACPSGGEWRDDLKQCATSCSSRGQMDGWHRWDGGGHSACVDGCSFEGAGMCAGDNCAFRDLTPTGAQCTTGPTPTSIRNTPDGVCNPIGNRGAQHCVSAGDPPRHCIVHASGLSQCWDGTESGPRVDRSGAHGASREPVPTTPAPHPNQEGAKPEGSDTATTRDGQGGGGSFNVVEFSGTGNSADASDNGSGPGQGSAPGWGNTIGQGPGNSDGDGDTGDGPGKAAPGLGEDFYEGDERTISDLVNNYKDRVSNAPIASALDDVFTMPQGGSCPTFSVPASYFWDELVFDFHCKPPLDAILAMMGWVVLAIAAMAAIRIAIE